MNRNIEGVLGRWSDGPGPLHRKLSDALRRAIARGHLAAGERLPSERELASRLAVSRSTVVTAYDTLRQQGLLESRQGSGTRICARVGRTAEMETPLSPIYRTLIDGPGDLISLACAVFPAHPLVIEAMVDVAREDVPKLTTHNGYVPAGLPPLREAVAEMMTRNGTPTGPEQVLITTGAQQAVSLATQMVVRPGDDVIAESPSFSGTMDLFRNRGANFVAVPVDDDGIDVREVRATASSRRPAAIYVMPTYHNPTGALLAPHRRRELAELVAAEGIPLVEDNALEGAALDDDDVPYVAAFAPPDAPVLTVGSLSKAAWGGLRIGWIRGPEALVDRLIELKAMTDLGSPFFDQLVAARIVPQLDRLRADHRVHLRRNLALVTDLLAESLPSWEWRVPRGGPSLWIRLPAGTAAAFAQVALRYGVEVIPGDYMSPHGEHAEYLRFPFTEEPPVLEETVRRLALAWEAYAPTQETREPGRRVVV
ncbi:MAG TPA: PLP-dependent aminotransferase family protein [Acidimicrobiales bacterium]